MFGRRRGKRDDEQPPEPIVPEPDRGADEDEDPRPDVGPYEFAEVEDRLDDIAPRRLDLGSVLLPLLDGMQLQVELAPDGSPQAVHLAGEHGRVTVGAYAAPKSPGQWRSVITDLAEQMRADDAQVSVERGPWGRELVAVLPQAAVRFIGVDGYRWMVRLIAAGPQPGAVADDSPLITTARAILAGTVVRRDAEPHPVRSPLPVELPAALAEQLATAHRDQAADPPQAPAEPAEPPAPAAPPSPRPRHAQPDPEEAGFEPAVPPKPARRGAQGSAMQQLGG